MACAPKQRVKSLVVRFRTAYWGFSESLKTEEGWKRHLKMFSMERERRHEWGGLPCAHGAVSCCHDQLDPMDL